KQISVDIIPVAGDAEAGNDFQLSNSTVIFQPGETSKSVSIDFVGEADFDKLVAFRLKNTVNAQTGAKDLHVIVINKTPKLTAYAGSVQFVRDSDKNGNEHVTLDGSQSFEPASEIASFVWTIKGIEIAKGVNPTVSLPVGIHNIVLTVSNSKGDISTDEVIITIVEDSGVWLEAECGIVGSLWNIESDESASSGRYVTVQPGNNSVDAAPIDASGVLQYTFNAPESGVYTLYARVICPNADDDSFWLKMDNGD